MHNLPYDVNILSPLDRWCVHSYYSICPYAPDKSGRVLVSGTDLDTHKTYVYIVSSKGEVLAAIENSIAESNFYHTGCWQTWSSDAKSVYYQGGTMEQPLIYRYDIESGKTVSIKGDMEGAPPFNEPIVSGFLGMLYAAGYADGNYYPEKAPIPFGDRDSHGLFSFDITKNEQKLLLSVNDILKIHPEREKLINLEKEYIKTSGNLEGYTLMAYCVRWNPKGDRCLFYFGNHCVDSKRKEPKLCYVFTANRDFSDISLALDLSFDHPGVHWSWHPDGIHLVGYACHPDNDMKMCLCSVKYDGTDFKVISRNSSGGHASISPADYNLLVVDNFEPKGRIAFIDLETDTEIGHYTLPREYGTVIPPGRNPYRVCHHPVFSPDGKKIIINFLPDKNSVVAELDVIERKND